jgi:hypothetical protein
MCVLRLVRLLARLISLKLYKRSRYHRRYISASLSYENKNLVTESDGKAKHGCAKIFSLLRKFFKVE